MDGDEQVRPFFIRDGGSGLQRNETVVVPPRWKITGQKTGMMKPRGVDLIPRHKELLVADMRLNSILVYYFPEMF